MKRSYRPFSTAALWMLTLGAASCGSGYRTTTQVNPDGSCLREVYARGNSDFLTGDMSNNPYLFHLDSSWQITALPDARGREHNVKVSKAFRTVEAISGSFRPNKKYVERQWEDYLRPIAAPAEVLQKRFRWFYTYYTFKATYPSIADKIPVSVEKYMSREEQKLWFLGDFSGYREMNGFELKDEMEAIEFRFLAWYVRNFYEYSFEAICDVERLSGGSPYTALLPAAKDTLSQLTIIQALSDGKKSDLSVGVDVDSLYRLTCTVFDSYFNTRRFSDLCRENKRQMDSLYSKKSEQLNFMKDNLFIAKVDYELVFFGELVSGNAPLICGDTLIWKVTAMRFTTDSCELTATFRTAHVWAFVVTFMLAAFAAYCLIRTRAVRWWY
ncbi:MAG: hypothetical protein LBH84_09305 [Prevotellaceae bacterium]|jgi:hypothetical protein|nr:hypothetical protein [Prevotellaceae bacterium]